MVIKKSIIRFSIPVLIVAVIIGSIAIISKVKKSKEERARQELIEDIERKIDREYRSLKSSFDYYAEIACDWDYSNSTREHAAKKMHELTGFIWHDGWSIYLPNEMKAKIYERKTEIDQALRVKATDNIWKELL